MWWIEGGGGRQGIEMVRQKGRYRDEKGDIRQIGREIVRDGGIKWGRQKGEKEG